MAAVADPKRIFCTETAGYVISEPSPMTNAPIMAGRDKRKEYLPAVSRSTFRNSAVDMVDPDREMPGIMAKPCTNPMINASFERTCFKDRPFPVT